MAAVGYATLTIGSILGRLRDNRGLTPISLPISLALTNLSKQGLVAVWNQLCFGHRPQLYVVTYAYLISHHCSQKL